MSGDWCAMVNVRHVGLHHEMKQTPNKPKLYVVTKFIFAKDIPEALRLEKKHAPQDVYVEADWRKNHGV